MKYEVYEFSMVLLFIAFFYLIARSLVSVLLNDIDILIAVYASGILIVSYIIYNIRSERW